MMDHFGISESVCAFANVTTTLLAPQPALDQPSLLADDSTIIVALALALDRALDR
jgi:hypothetical protein